MLYGYEGLSHRKEITDWDLTELNPHTVINGKHTLDDIQHALSNGNNGLPKLGVPVIYSRNKIQYKKFFSKKLEDCLVISNAYHSSDYFKVVIESRYTNKQTKVSVYYTGISVLSGKANMHESGQANAITNSLIGKYTKTDEIELMEEYRYYHKMGEILEKVFKLLNE